MQCLLEQDAVVDLDQALAANPLLVYSARYWYEHVASRRSCNCHHKDKDRRIRDKIADLFSPAFLPNFNRWLQLHNPDSTEVRGQSDEDTSTYPEPLYFALLLGFGDIAHDLIRDNVEADGRGGREGSVLQLAAHRGYTSIV